MAVPGTIARMGPYLLERELGRGGMGIVHEARHETTGARVALKTAVAPEPGALEGLRREIHALARLSHPQIARIVEEGAQGGVPWYAMEIAAGEDLRQRCRPLVDAWRRSEGSARDRALVPVLELFRLLCAPLAHLHAEGLVHRDIKPGNVIVRADGTPCLVDFGLSQWSSGTAGRELLQVADAAGTGAFMAPEQMRGEVLDARADLYAVGSMLFALLAGCAPFATGAEVMDPDAVAPRLRHTAPVPPELDDVVARLLAKRPEQRLGYADDLERALASITGAPVAPRHARPYLYRARLAGRGELLEALDAFVKGRLSGHGAVVLLRGESGIGKTRLAVEVARRQAARRTRVLPSACPASADGRSPVEVLARAIAEAAGGDEALARSIAPHARILAPLAPALAALPAVAMLPEPESIPAREARLRLFAALAEALVALARARPLLWMIDDLHAADGATGDFLRLLVAGGRIARAPVVIMATSRAEEEHPALRALATSPGCFDVALGALDDGAVGAIVGDMLALPDPAPAFVERLGARSDGNPFFVSEYLRAALAEGHLSRDAMGVWNVSTRAAAGELDWGMPRGVRELVTRRLDRLSPPARQLAVLASALGRELEGAIFDAAAPLEGDARREALSELVARQVLEEPEPGALRFLHDQIREAAYAIPGGAERVALHRRCASAMAGLGPERAAERARHWERADEPVAARRDYLDGARRAVVTGAFPEAEALYRDHLRLASSPDADAVEARLELAQRLLVPRGKPADALETLVRAREEAAALGLHAREARLVMAMALATQAQGRWDDARSLYESARELMRAGGDGAGEAEALHRLGDLAHQQGRLDEARRAYEEGLALARRAGDRSTEGILASSTGLLDMSEGRLAEAEAALEGGLALLRAAGNRQWEAITLGNLANLHLLHGQGPRAIAAYEGVLAAARRLGVRRMEAMALHNLAIVRAEWSTDPEAPAQAVAQCREAIGIVRELEDRRTEGMLENGLIGLLLAEGDDAAARELALRALETHRSHGNRRWEADALHALALIAEAQGELGEASRLADEARELAVATRDPLFESSVELTLARLARSGGGDPDGRDPGPHLARAGALVEGAPGPVRALHLCAVAEEAIARGERPELAAIAEAIGAIPVAPRGQLGRALARLEGLGAKVALPSPPG